jgi:uncharacterized protein YjbI with pentapeptide repeats/beta-lactamase regulating signal transducer with metallopeptidase domain
MTAVEQFLRSPVMKPLGWTLVQFCWQGAVVALQLAGMLLVLRRRSADARYLAACAALLLMAASPVVTLAFLTGGPDQAAVVPSNRTAAARTFTEGRTALTSPRSSAFPLTLPRSAEKLGAMRRLMGVVSHWAPSQVLEPALPWMVAAWLIGILLLCLRLLGGWRVVQRLARRETRPVQEWLQGRAEELARRLGVRRSVDLLESALVEVPTVLGCVRAVVLVPASALTGLSPQQLEALLAHELAHIRRYDYLVNLIQTTVETLLFYHPAVWWVSHQIRAERENCCDDLAVAAIGDRLTYARALAALEELRAAPTRLALAGSGGDLLARIRRILGLPSGQTDPAPAWLAGTVLLPLLLAAASMPHASTDGESPRHPRRSHGSAPIISMRSVEAPTNQSDSLPSDTARRDAASPRALQGDARRLRTALPLPKVVRAGQTMVHPSPQVPSRSGATPASPVGVIRPDTGFRIAGGRGQSELLSKAITVRPIRVPRDDAFEADSQQAAAAPIQAGPVLTRRADAAPAASRSEGSHPRSMDLTRVNLSGADLKGLDLTEVSLKGAPLSTVDLSGLDLTGKDLSHADLSGANLTGTRLAGADLTEANLSGADLTNADLSHCKSTGANLSGASLHGTRLAGMDLTRVDLSGADLRGLDLKEVRLAGAALSGADLAGWDLSRQDLSRVDLSGANLTGTRLVGAVLTDANLSGANLTDTDLSHARMSGANFSGARLHGTRLVGVDLAHVNLSGADLSGLKLTGVDLAGVPLPAVSLAGRNLIGGFP